MGNPDRILNNVVWSSETYIISARYIKFFQSSKENKEVWAGFMIQVFIVNTINGYMIMSRSMKREDIRPNRGRQRLMDRLDKFIINDPGKATKRPLVFDFEKAKYLAVESLDDMIKGRKDWFRINKWYDVNSECISDVSADDLINAKFNQMSKYFDEYGGS